MISSRHITYERLAQRAIKLLQEKLWEDFGITVISGVELEYIVYGNDKNAPIVKCVDRSKDTHTDRFEYRPRSEIVSNDPGKITGSNYLDRSRYLSHIYKDAKRDEAVFSHLAENSPLRMAGAVENFKQHLLGDNLLTGKKCQISLLPYHAHENITCGTEINFSLNDSGRPVTGYIYMSNIIATLEEVLYFGINTNAAINRLKEKFALRDELTMYDFLDPKPTLKPDHLEVDYLAPDSNTYLGYAGLLAAIYNTASGYKFSPDSLPSGSVLHNLNFRNSNQAVLGALRENLQQSVHFRNCLNNLSPDGKLGDYLIESCLEAETLVSAAVQQKSLSKAS